MTRKRRVFLITCIVILLFILVEEIQTYDPAVEEAIVAVEKEAEGLCVNGVIEEDINHELPADQYEYSQVIGTLTFVESGVVAPIVYGNPDDGFVAAMEYGAAYDPTSSPPGGDATTVISGHKNDEFGELEHVEVGDALVLEIDGNIYTYEVTNTEIIEDSDVDKVYYDENNLVIYTCYPFSYQSFYSQRYSVTAEQVSEVSCQ